MSSCVSKYMFHDHYSNKNVNDYCDKVSLLQTGLITYTLCKIYLYFSTYCGVRRVLYLVQDKFYYYYFYPSKNTCDRDFRNIRTRWNDRKTTRKLSRRTWTAHSRRVTTSCARWASSGLEGSWSNSSLGESDFVVINRVATAARVSFPRNPR